MGLVLTAREEHAVGSQKHAGAKQKINLHSKKEEVGGETRLADRKKEQDRDKKEQTRAISNRLEFIRNRVELGTG